MTLNDRMNLWRIWLALDRRLKDGDERIGFLEDQLRQLAENESLPSDRCAELQAAIRAQIDAVRAEQMTGKEAPCAA